MGDVGDLAGKRGVVVFRRTCTCMTSSFSVGTYCLLSLSRRHSIDTNRVGRMVNTVGSSKISMVLTRRLCKGDVKSAMSHRASIRIVCVSPLGEKRCSGSDCLSNVRRGVRLVGRTFAGWG